MADDKLPPGSGEIVVRDREQAQALARRQHEKPKDEQVYWCTVCGFAPDGNVENVKYPRGLTLKFSPEEIELLGGDINSYSGPCPVCKSETLVPMDQFFGAESAFAMDREQRRKEYGDQAEVFIDRVKGELAGGIFAGAGAGARTDGSGNDDLPDASGVDVSDLKPRS